MCIRDRRETRPGQEHNGLIYVMAVLTVEPDIGGEQPRKRFHAIRAQLGDGGVSAGGEHAEQRLHAMLALALRHAVQPGVQRAAEISRDVYKRQSDGVAEGVATASAVVELGEKYHVDTPLAKAVTRVLDDGISFSQMVSEMFPQGITVE